MRERPATVNLFTRLLAWINDPGRGRGICPDCRQTVDLFFVHARQDADGTVYRCPGLATGATR